jgi:hypothetical protein
VPYKGPERREASEEEQLAWRQANLLRSRAKEVLQAVVLIASFAVAIVGSHFTLRQEIAVLREHVQTLHADALKLEQTMTIMREQEHVLELSVKVLEERTKQLEGHRAVTPRRERF